MPPVIVIGSARGGTSAVSGVLQILGLDMGNTWRGYNEDPDLRFPAHKTDEIAVAVEKRVERGLPWGWKDACFVLYLDEALPIIPEGSRYVYVTRDPEMVVDSMYRHAPYPETPRPETLRLAVEWQKLVQEFMATHPGFNVGDFDEFRENPDQVIEQLADWLPGDKSQIDRAKRYIAHKTYVDPLKVV